MHGRMGYSSMMARQKTCAIDLTPFKVFSTGGSGSGFDAAAMDGGRTLLPESTEFWSCIDANGAPNFSSSGQVRGLCCGRPVVAAS
jgi:hypothetical protein